MRYFLALIFVASLASGCATRVWGDKDWGAIGRFGSGYGGAPWGGITLAELTTSEPWKPGEGYAATTYGYYGVNESATYLRNLTVPQELEADYLLEEHDEAFGETESPGEPTSYGLRAGGAPLSQATNLPFQSGSSSPYDSRYWPGVLPAGLPRYSYSGLHSLFYSSPRRDYVRIDFYGKNYNRLGYANIDASGTINVFDKASNRIGHSTRFGSFVLYKSAFKPRLLKPGRIINRTFNPGKPVPCCRR